MIVNHLQGRQGDKKEDLKKGGGYLVVDTGHHLVTLQIVAVFETPTTQTDGDVDD